MITIARMSRLQKESLIIIVGTPAFQRIAMSSVPSVAVKMDVHHLVARPTVLVEIQNGIETRFPV